MKGDSRRQDSREELKSEWFADLLKPHEPPCISLYMPMQRNNPQAAETPREFRDLIDKMQASLRRRYDERTVRALTDRIQSIAPTPEFWVGDRDGLAVFCGG